MKALINSPQFRRSMALFSPALIPAIAILYVCSVSRNWKPRGDSALIMMLARSILAGRGYTYLGYPCLKVPFGLPFLISPIMWLTNTNFLALNLYMLVFAGVAFWAVYLTFGKLFSRAYALLITFLTAWSSLALFQSGYIMTDVPYMAFSFLSLYFVLTYTNEEPTTANGIAVVGLILVSVFLRLIGLTLAGGVFLFVLAQKRHLFVTARFAVLTAMLVIPITAWMLHSQFAAIDAHDPVRQLTEFIVPKEESQLYKWSDPTSRITGIPAAVQRGAENLAYYGGVSYSIVTGIPTDTSKENLRRFSFMHLGLMGAIALTLFIGTLRSLFTTRSLLDFYFIFYMIIILAWSARESRYLLPVLPLIIHYFLSGLVLIADLVQRGFPLVNKRIPELVFGSVVVFCALYVPANTWQDINIIKRQHANPYYTQDESDYFQAAEWLKTNTKNDARVVGITAPKMAFLSQRWCVTFPRVEDQRRLLAFLDEIQADYLLLSPGDANDRNDYLVSLVDKNPILFQKEFTRGSTAVYKIDRDRLGNDLTMSYQAR